MAFIRKINRWDILYLTFSTLMNTLLGLVLPFSILIIFDRILPNQSHDSLLLLFGFILVCIWLDFYLKVKEEKLTSLITARYEGQLANKVFESICLSHLGKFGHFSMGEYLERIASIGEIKSFFGGDSLKAWINGATGFITVVLIFIINIGAGLTLLIASLILLIAAHFLSNKRTYLLEKRRNAEGLTNSKIIEIVTSPTEIKTRSMEYRLENLMASMIEEREEHSVEYEKLEGRFNLILNLIQQLSVAIVVVLCALSVINLQISQGVMAAVILLTNRYFSPYQQVMQTYSRWKLNQLNLERICALLALKQKASATNANTITPITNIKILFNQKDIFMERGKGYLFSGVSGSGKSHVTRCLTMEEKTENLAIFINGKPLGDIEYQDWQNAVIRINQHSTLVEGNIIDNLTCFRPHLNTAAYSLCDNLGIKRPLDQLKNGFFTQLKGNSQLPFSRQTYYGLLAVRALLSQKSILIFDDFDLYFDKVFAERFLACINAKAEHRVCILISNKFYQIQHKWTKVQFDTPHLTQTPANTAQSLIESLL